MTAVLKMNVQDLDAQFVEDLKGQFAHADLEIRVHEPPGASAFFSEENFWQTIALLDWGAGDDEYAVMAPAVAALAEHPIAHIYRFADILSEKLWALDNRSHAQVFIEEEGSEGYLSADDFLYARCAVVAQGPDFYEKVFQNPAEMPLDMTFEPLLNLAGDAYERKTGRELLAAPTFNYETYSNKKGWQK